MSRVRRGGIVAGALLAVGALASRPGAGTAQGGPGFLFREPTVTIRLETGYDVRFANSDAYDFTRQQLTVSKHDFFASSLGGEVAVRAAERWDVALGLGYAKSSKLSEFREWVDLDGLPIEQVTELRTVPLTVTAKYYFDDRGRSVGRFAWVPHTFNPYVGGGIGLVSYRFEQVGDFVDFDTLEIFYDSTESTGQAFLARAVGGFTLSLTGQLELGAEMRYTRARATMGRDYDGFDALDLSGLAGVVSIGIRF